MFLFIFSATILQAYYAFSYPIRETASVEPSRLFFYSLTAGLFAFSFLVTYTTQDVSFVVSLTGAITGGPLAFLLPAISLLILQSYQRAEQHLQQPFPPPASGTLYGTLSPSPPPEVTSSSSFARLAASSQPSSSPTVPLLHEARAGEAGGIGKPRRNCLRSSPMLTWCDTLTAWLVLVVGSVAMVMGIFYTIYNRITGE